MNKQEILNELDIKLNDYPFILFDDAVEMPSLNNSIKEFGGGDPIWEDMSVNWKMRQKMIWKIFCIG